MTDGMHQEVDKENRRRCEREWKEVEKENGKRWRKRLGSGRDRERKEVEKEDEVRWRNQEDMSMYH